MPRYLVTEKVYVEASSQKEAEEKVDRKYTPYSRESVEAEQVTPELKVGMPVRLVSGGATTVHVDLYSEGAVVDKGTLGRTVVVLFHAPHRLGYGHEWTYQHVRADYLEVVGAACGHLSPTSPS